MRTSEIAGFILFPWYRSLMLWDFVSILFLAYTALVMPYRLAFELLQPVSSERSGLDTFELLIDIFFLVDILRNFVTASHDLYGELIVEPRQIALQYLKTWFTLDLVASFPFEYVHAQIAKASTHL